MEGWFQAAQPECTPQQSAGALAPCNPHLHRCSTRPPWRRTTARTSSRCPYYSRRPMRRPGSRVLLKEQAVAAKLAAGSLFQHVRNTTVPWKRTTGPPNPGSPRRTRRLQLKSRSKRAASTSMSKWMSTSTSTSMSKWAVAAAAAATAPATARRGPESKRIARKQNQVQRLLEQRQAVSWDSPCGGSRSTRSDGWDARTRGPRHNRSPAAVGPPQSKSLFGKTGKRH
mmetsp:Transcript_77766/g.251952  ORF Transcript_77766/g.251952 Transcript_77766/m.251952 type:complete len:227 (+) Transcript_77766:289-969(+)